MLWVHVPYTKHKNDLVSIQEEICSQYHYDYDDYFNAYQNKKINYIVKVKNKKKAFKHRLKKQGLFNNLKAPVPPVPPVAPQPFAESKTVAKEEVVTTDLSLESFAELPEVDGLRSNLVETLYNEGLTSVAAFATVTEEEVLALKGVGPATVKKLKENGVSFKA